MVFYKKEGFPNKGDIVLCKVKKILPHSVFVELLEYKNKEGMIHISELSRRWTKDINELVKVGEQIICKVENVDKNKGYIDLSKKRVTSGEEKNKKTEIKNENHIEKVIEHVCKKNNISLEEFYNKTGYKILEEYGTLYNFYENFKENKDTINDLNLDKKIVKEIEDAFKSLIKKTRVNVKKEFEFYAEGGDGIIRIKEFVKELLKSANDEDNTLEITYINAPKYLFSVDSNSYKEADSFLNRVRETMSTLSKKYNIELIK